MRILIFHGYLLRGTGSNVYNAGLAAALRVAGHEVHLLAQEREPEELGFVDAVGAWRGGELHVETLRRSAAPSTAPTSAACCRCTSPTATRASRRASTPS